MAMNIEMANTVRKLYLNEIIADMESNGEDVARISSNAINLPFVYKGEEGVLEITVKITKKPYDECMAEREDYIKRVAAAAERKERAEKKAAENKAKAAAKAQKKSTENSGK